MESINLVIVGGAVSLVSALATIIVQHWLDLRKVRSQLREYPSRIIYDKQMQFFERMLSLFDRLNGYITRIDVWLGESGKKAREEVEEAAKDSYHVGVFSQVIDEYYLYLPKSFLEEARNLLTLCRELGQDPTKEGAYNAIRALFSFENKVREQMGVDALSAELLKAFGAGKKERQRVIKEE